MGTDDMNQTKLAVSMTASWAWGVSLGVGHTIMISRGLLPFLIWAVVNTLSLLFFGWFIKKNPRLIQITKNAAIKVFMLVTQIYAVWINTRIMSQYLSSITIHHDIIAGGIVLVVMVLVFLWKFSFSVKSDQWQYAVMIMGLLAAAVIAIIHGQAKEITGYAGAENIRWAGWMALGLLVAPFHNAMYYQREEYATSLRPYILHALFFGVYMALVGITGYYGHVWSGVLISAVIIAIATSTQDSAIAAMQYLVGSKSTIIISLAVLLLWPFSTTTPILWVWGRYQVARIFIVLPVLIYYWRWSDGKR